MKIDAYKCDICGFSTCKEFFGLKKIDGIVYFVGIIDGKIHICKECHDLIGKHYENINRKCSSDSKQLSTCQL